MSKLWGPEYPSKVFLYPTMLCNLNCKMCYSGGCFDEQKSIMEDLDLIHYKKAIDELYQLGVRYYDISGGEPFLSKYIVDICKYIKKYPDNIIYLVSNGTLITRKSDVVIDCMQYVDLLKISLDSPYPDKHNEIRGNKAAYMLTQEGIDFLLDQGIDNIGINFVVMDSNMEEIYEMLEYVSRKGIKNISLLRLIDVSPRNTLESENLVLEKISTLIQLVKKWIQDNTKIICNPLEITLVLPGYSLFVVNEIYKHNNVNKKITFKIEYDPIRGCPAFGDSIVITNSGMVTGCTGMVNLSDMYIGDIKKEKLEKIHKKSGEMRKRIRDRELYLKQQEPCASCEYWFSCRGGCPATAYRYNYSFDSVDPTCCKK